MIFVTPPAEKLQYFFGVFLHFYIGVAKIAADRILAIVIPDAAPTRRMILAARKAEKLIDASYGRKTRSVLVMDNGFVVLSSVQPETLVTRLKE